MEKNCVSINDIKEKTRKLIDNILEADAERFKLNDDDTLSDALNSMEICLLIVELEGIYQVEFPIELFCKDDSITTLAKKVYELWERKN